MDLRTPPHCAGRGSWRLGLSCWDPTARLSSGGRRAGPAPLSLRLSPDWEHVALSPEGPRPHCPGHRCGDASGGLWSLPPHLPPPVLSGRGGDGSSHVAEPRRPGVRPRPLRGLCAGPTGCPSPLPTATVTCPVPGPLSLAERREPVSYSRSHLQAGHLLRPGAQPAAK